MKKIFLLFVCILLSTVKIIMAQSLGLSKLLEFQQNQSPIYIHNFLTNLGEWVSQYDSIDNSQKSYNWYKAGVGAEFELSEVDRLSFSLPLQNFGPAILYLTFSKSIFESLKAEIEATMNLDTLLINDPRVKMYKYNNNNNFVLELIEPLQPQKGDTFKFAFVVYNKQDYERGFKIR